MLLHYKQKTSVAHAKKVHDGEIHCRAALPLLTAILAALTRGPGTADKTPGNMYTNFLPAIVTASSSMLLAFMSLNTAKACSHSLLSSQAAIRLEKTYALGWTLAALIPCNKHLHSFKCNDNNLLHITRQVFHSRYVDSVKQ